MDPPPHKVIWGAINDPVSSSKPSSILRPTRRVSWLRNQVVLPWGKMGSVGKPPVATCVDKRARLENDSRMKNYAPTLAWRSERHRLRLSGFCPPVEHLRSNSRAHIVPCIVPFHTAGKANSMRLHRSHFEKHVIVNDTVRSKLLPTKTIMIQPSGHTLPPRASAFSGRGAEASTRSLNDDVNVRRFILIMHTSLPPCACKFKLQSLDTHRVDVICRCISSVCPPNHS